MLLAASLLCSGLSIATTAWIKSNGRQEGLWADCVSPTGDILSYECSANQPRGQYQPSIHRGRGGQVPPPGSLSMYTCSPREPIFFENLDIIIEFCLKVKEIPCTYRSDPFHVFES